MSSEKPVRPKSNHIELAKKLIDIVSAKGMSVGDRLPEKYFADQCGVSRTLIRSAFRLLKERGVLDWKEEVGYTLIASSHDLLDFQDGLPAASESALADQILLDRTARRIAQSVSVSALTRRYNVTRQRVLSALQKLQSDDLVSQSASQSWVFQTLLDNADSIKESLEYRLVAEPAAILANGFKLHQQLAVSLRKQIESFLKVPVGGADLQLFIQQDVEFHLLLATSSGNRFLADSLTNHHRLRQLPNARISLTDFRMRQAHMEHLEILTMIESGQFDAAADMMKVHLRLSQSLRPSTVNRGSPPLFK